MIRHTILFKLKSNVSQGLFESAVSKFQQLKIKLPGVLEICAGECQFFDEKSQHFFEESISHVISIDFKDDNALNQFVNNPVTHPMKEAIVSIAEGGYENIFGFDLK